MTRLDADVVSELTRPTCRRDGQVGAIDARAAEDFGGRRSLRPPPRPDRARWQAGGSGARGRRSGTRVAGRIGSAAAGDARPCRTPAEGWRRAFPPQGRLGRRGPETPGPPPAAAGADRPKARTGCGRAPRSQRPPDAARAPPPLRRGDGAAAKSDASGDAPPGASFRRPARRRGGAGRAGAGGSPSPRRGRRARSTPAAGAGRGSCRRRARRA